MVDGPQGLAYFPGITQIVSAVYTRAHGTAPGVALVVIAPQQDFTAEIGDLTLAFGNEQLNFRNCKLDYTSFEFTESGFIWRLSILDRRWMWTFGEISGHYNLRYEDGTIRQDTALTPQELAGLCLDALGEADYDVGDLPNATYPLVEWELANPAQALAELCENLGCHVVLQLNDTVAVRVVGEGSDLPDGPIMEDSLTLNPPELPDAMAVVTAPIRFQCDLLLEAVGLQSDGTVQPIDQLSYKPPLAGSNWSTSDWPDFRSVFSSLDDRELARRTVFRWYRVQIPEGGLVIPGYDGSPIMSLDCILPLDDVQNDSTTVQEQDVQVVRPLPASIHGVWLGQFDQGFLNTLQVADPLAASELTPDASAKGARYCRAFQLDKEHGVVKFDECVLMNTQSDKTLAPTYGPALLRLRTVVSVRDPDTRALTRKRRLRSYAHNGTPTRFIVHEDIVPRVTPNYSSDSSYTVESIERNDDDVDTECDYYLDAAEKEYELTAPLTLKYAGLVPVELDGAVSQVTFEISPAGTTTTAARNTERVLHTLPYQERRRIEKFNRLLEGELKSRPTARRLAAKTFNLFTAPLPSTFWSA